MQEQIVTGKQARKTGKQASEREISEIINNLKQQAKTVLERISKTQIDFTTLQKQIEKEKNEQIQRTESQEEREKLELEAQAKKINTFRTREKGAGGTNRK